MATDNAVKNTTTKAKLKIILRHRQSSFQEVDQTASYNSGGKKMMNINSGSILIGGTPGIKLITSPANTSRTGYATWIFLATMISMVINRTKNK